MYRFCVCILPEDHVDLEITTDRNGTEFEDIQKFVNEVNSELGATAPITMKRCPEMSDHECVYFHAYKK